MAGSRPCGDVWALTVCDCRVGAKRRLRQIGDRGLDLAEPVCVAGVKNGEVRLVDLACCVLLLEVLDRPLQELTLARKGARVRARVAATASATVSACCEGSPGHLQAAAPPEVGGKEDRAPADDHGRHHP